MPTNLLDYIKKSFVQGLRKDQVEASLLQSGWTKEQIADAFERIDASQEEFIERYRRRILPSKKFLTGVFRIAVIITVIIAFFAGVYLAIKYVTRPKPSIIAGLKIDGDANCVAKTNEAINLLKIKLPDQYASLAKYVTLIKCDKFTSTPKYSVKKGKGLTEFRIDPKTVDAGPVWYAGAIVHETCHARQFQEWEAIKASLSPEELEREKNRDLEKECFAVSYDVLKKLDADQSTLDYAKNIH